MIFQKINLVGVIRIELMTSTMSTAFIPLNYTPNINPYFLIELIEIKNIDKILSTKENFFSFYVSPTILLEMKLGKKNNINNFILFKLFG